ncbi:MAG: response regulator [Chloroflexales bacterium]
MTYRLIVVTAENEILRALPAALGATVSVQIFESANDALWEMRVNPPDAVIAEVDLPGMTGLELAEIIPNFEIQTNVLLYSASMNDTACKRAEALGVYQFLHGPSAVDNVHAAIRSALHAAHEATAAAVASAAAAAAAAAAAPVPEPTPAPEVRPRRVGLRTVSAAPPAARANSPAADPKAERHDFTPARVVLPSAREREQDPPPAPAPASPPPPQPARVVLPSAREREQAAAAPPPPPQRGGLASRTKAAAGRKPAPKPEPIPMHDIPGRRSSSTMIVTTENINAVRKIMSQIAQELGAQSVMLTDRAGMVLVDVGSTDNLPMMIILPLLSTSFSTAGEVARQLHEEDALTVYIHDGLHYDLYCFDVAHRFLLVLVFNKKVASSKIGAVWVNAKRAIRELRDNLSDA